MVKIVSWFLLQHQLCTRHKVLVGGELGCCGAEQGQVIWCAGQYLAKGGASRIGAERVSERCFQTTGLPEMKKKRLLYYV